MATTFQDLAIDALTDLGVLAAGEPAETDDLLTALRAMNRLIDQWAAERLNIYTVTETTWSIVSGTQTYTVGSGGVVNIPRPTYINKINYRYTPTGSTVQIDFPMSKFTDDEWASQTLKLLQSTLPRAFYYNPTYPLGTLTLWPIPVSPPAPLTGVLYAPQQVGEFTALSTLVDLPPGYRRMIVKGLAVELAAAYQRNLPDELRQHAEEAKSVVKRSNLHLMDMSFDNAVLGSASARTYYIRSGD